MDAINEIDMMVYKLRELQNEIRNLEAAVPKREEPRDKRKLIANKAKCPKCQSVIESKHHHDFVTCKCGATSVDGGLEYLRRCFDPKVGYIECSEYLEGMFNED